MVDPVANLCKRSVTSSNPAGKSQSLPGGISRSMHRPGTISTGVRVFFLAFLLDGVSVDANGPGGMEGSAARLPAERLQYVNDQLQ